MADIIGTTPPPTEATTMTTTGKIPTSPYTTTFPTETTVTSPETTTNPPETSATSPGTTVDPCHFAMHQPRNEFCLAEIVEKETLETWESVDKNRIPVVFERSIVLTKKKKVE